MGNVMSINDIAGAVDQFPDVSSKFAEPDTLTSGAGSQTPGVISVDVRVFVVSETIHVVCKILVNAGRRVDAIYELAWEWLCVALACGQIVVVMVKTGMETRIGGRNSGDIV